MNFFLVRDFQSLSIKQIFNWVKIALPKSNDFELLPDLIVEHLPHMEQLKSSFAELENASQKEFSVPFVDTY